MIVNVIFTLLLLLLLYYQYNNNTNDNNNTQIMVILDTKNSARNERGSALGKYTRSPLQDFRLFGPRPWKMLAATNENNDFWATQTLAKILWAGILLWRPGVASGE